MGPTLTWYQNVDGVDGAVFKDPRRKESRFWGEGRWDNFIKPLLPKERGPLIEIGCSAGLFLKMAMDEGFRDVIGIDSSARRIRQAERFKESNGYPYKLMQQKVGKDFDLDQLPLADVTLLANVHYYFPVSVFSNLVDRLKSRTLYCLLVSARAKRRQGNAVHYLDAVRGYFRDWQEVGVVGDWQGLEVIADDPSPRLQMYGVVFRGNLDAHNVEEIYGRCREASAESKKQKHFAICPALEEFFRKVLSGETFEFEETLLYQYWKTRRPGWSSDQIQGHLAYKKSLAKDVQINGMKEPLYYDQEGKLLDGLHRLVIARELGYKHILVRRL